MIRVVPHGVESIVFPFGGTPYVKIGASKWGHKVEVDPTPAYGHDPEIVQRELERAALRFPIPWPVTIDLLPVECLSRTNGATYTEYDYSGPQDKNGAYTSILGSIYFSAKRIPIHPSVTRYLVAHEYGHVIEEWLNKQRDGAQLSDGALLKEYAAMRGVSFPIDYGAGLWHRTPGEVFANDFRLIVCRVEREYWPHPDIPRPDRKVARWWRRQRGG